jgi:hypothetical protein
MLAQAQAAFQERLELTDGEAEKLRLHDRRIETVGDTLRPEARVSLFLERAEIVSDRAGKLRLYDELIEFCEQSLQDMANSGEAPDGSRVARLMSGFSRVIKAKAALMENVSDKLKLYDYYLALPQAQEGVLSIHVYEDMISEKAEISGDLSIKNEYYDRHIKNAGTDTDRVKWYSRKLLHTSYEAHTAERAAIEDEVISRFFDNTEEEVEGNVALIFWGKMKKTANEEEKAVFTDRLITRYKNSHDSLARSVVINALKEKAKMAQDDTTKIEAYSTIIDQYKNVGDYFVSKSVNEAIAAKYQLEMKSDAGK